MKRHLTACVLAFLSLGAAPPAELPRAMDPAGPPIWISLQSTVAGNQLDWSRLPRKSRHLLRVPEQAKPEAEPPVAIPGPPELVCDEFLMPPIPEVVTPRTFEELMSRARVIVRGRVEARTYGFFEGIPHALLRLGDLEIYRSTAKVDGSRMFLTFPWAAFRIHGQSVCTRHPGFDRDPQIGADVVLISYFEPRDLDGQILEATYFSTFWEDSLGFEMPAIYDGQLGATSIETLSAHIEGWMASDAGQ